MHLKLGTYVFYTQRIKPSYFGKPSQTVSRTVQPKTVAVIGYDYVGMKPTMLVGEGDVVKKANPYLKTKNALVWFTRHLKPERSKQSTVVQNVSLNPSKLNAGDRNFKALFGHRTYVPKPIPVTSGPAVSLML